MKILRKLVCSLLLLCLISALIPSALAAEGGEAFYKDKSWDDVVGYLFEKYDVDTERIGLGYLNTVTGEEHYFNGDNYMVAGSMYKIPLNMYFAEKIYNGEMDWDTQIGGIAYETLMRESIINSSNDYAKILWMEAGNGTYRTYRREIAPLMGEDPDTVDPKYYENNFFTPRQMITCLNLLASQSERFPKIIETMQEAEPHNYFKLTEQRYDIGHKYGFLLDGSRLYMCDAAVAYTDDPIVFVMFTDAVNDAYDVMGDFATLMCEYTQYNTKLRLEEEQKLKEIEQKEKEEAARMDQAITAVPEDTGEVIENSADAGGMSIGSVAGIVLTVVLMIAAIAAVVASRKKHRIKAGWAIAGIVLAAAAIFLSIIGAAVGTIIAKPTGDPQETAVQFMDSIIAGDYDTAYSMLKGYSSLGLENSPADEAGKLMYEALKESYSYQISGSCLVDKLHARQQIQLSYLNLPAMNEDIKDRTMVELEKVVRRHSKAELYDENNNYYPEITQEAYLNALKAVLKDAADYYETSGIQLQLEYSDGRWWVIPAEGLLKGLSGSTAK